jgi:hypothetical protein
MDEGRLTQAVNALNQEQRGAVEHIIGGWQTQNGSVRLTIIDGPPGTGKTYVAAVAAGEWCRTRNRPVIILTPTHQAARRAQVSLWNAGFDQHEALRLKPGSNHQPELGCLAFERIESLPPHLRRELAQARVLVTTWHGSQRALQVFSNFLLIFDEVSQIPYSAFLAQLRRAYPRAPLGFSLIGDPYQLPVVTTQEVLSTNAALGILRRHPECVPHRLLSQHRMNAPICKVVNEIRRVAFGGAPLQPANAIVADMTLDQITGHYQRGDEFDEILNPYVPVVFIDTSPFASERGYTEVAVGGSWAYEAEARLAVRLAQAVQTTYGASINNLAVLSPYRAQTALARSLGFQNSRTIYQAQGDEWDCIILTFGRTTIFGRTILDEVYQHTYVGLSRAKTKLIVLLNAGVFRPLRLFGPLLDAIPGIPQAQLIEANPQWGEL